MGWAGKKNGALLDLAISEQFDVLITADKNIEHQQNFAGRKIALLVLGAHSTKIKDLLPLLPAARTALDRLQPGTVVRVAAKS
jgi:hypothetical protein